MVCYFAAILLWQQMRIDLHHTLLTLQQMRIDVHHTLLTPTANAD